MWLKRSLLCVLVCMLFVSDVPAVQYAFQIAFSNKNGETINNTSPLSILSQRALDRRTNQGIALDSTDLPVPPAYIDSVLTLTGGEFHASSRWLNMCVILLTDSAQILHLQNKPYITSIQQVAYYSTQLHRVLNNPNNTTANGRSSAYRTTDDAMYYGNAFPQTALVNGTCLNDRNIKGQGKLIAVLDAGFSYADTNPGFDSLRQSQRIIDTHNFTLASDDIYNYDDHGMLVLSTMAGYIPDSFVGAAPLAEYALYITEDDSSEQPIELFNMIAGAERADSVGADVITTSLGYNTFDDPAYNFDFATDFDGKTTVAAKAANFATKKGILFVATAGNEGGDSWNMILTPGDADSALTVGATDLSGGIASFSGYGPNAAGVVKPDVCADGNEAATFTDAGYTGYNQGTSFSTPQIAGWSACLMQSASNTMIPYQVRTAIEKSASSYSTPGNQIGYGIPNFCTASQMLGVQTPAATPTSNWVTATPNPFTDNISLSVFATVTQQVSFRLIDIKGKIVATKEQSFGKGYNAPVQMSLPSSLSAGVYILKAVSDTQQQVVKLEKL